MSSTSWPRAVVVMGVSGSGKTTVGRALAALISCVYAEGDDFHPAANVAKMAAGTPLTDDDRIPWLSAIGRYLDSQIAAGKCTVVSCSALKRAYRDRLRSGREGLLRLVYLNGDRALIAGRLAGRAGHFFPAALLDSQFAELEPPAGDEHAIAVRPDEAADVLAKRIAARLEDVGRVRSS